MEDPQCFAWPQGYILVSTEIIRKKHIYIYIFIEGNSCWCYHKNCLTLFSNSRQEDLKTVLIHMYYVCQYTNNYPAFWWKKTYPFTCVCLTLPWKSHNKMASPTLISPRLSGVKATCWMWSEWPIKTYLKNRKKDFWLWFPVEVGMIQRSWNMQTFLYDESRFPSQSSIFSSSLDDKEKY